MLLTVPVGLTCAVAFATLAVLFAARGGRTSRPAVAGYSMIALWAAFTPWQVGGAGAMPAGDWVRPVDAVFGILRCIAPFLPLLALRSGAMNARTIPLGWRLTLGGVQALAVVLFAVDVLVGSASMPSTHWALVSVAGHLVLALLGLIVVENVWRNAKAEQLWSLKFLLIALGVLFAYDFYLFADALLFSRVDADLLAARPLVTVAAAPLIALTIWRGSGTALRLTMSRRAVFHTASLIGGGFYLLTMGGVGLYIRSYGGHWGPAFQVGFLVAAAILLALAVSSGSVRAWVRLLVAKHFFTYRYDYREEWLRFIATIAGDGSDANLRVRVIKAIAEVIDSPGGNLWLWDDASQSYTQAQAWNYHEVQGVEPASGSLATFLARSGHIVDLAEYVAAPQRYPGLDCPDWLLNRRGAWLIVPLLHREPLLGFVLLQQPRAARRLNWEDDDLLKTIGRQAAGFLAEQQASDALADVRQIELFNRRFAFVAHDIKTLISQLSLLLSNARKHGSDPAFQEDIVTTVRHSVDTMNQMLAQLNARQCSDLTAPCVDLVPLARRLVEQQRSAGSVIRLDCPMEHLSIKGDEPRAGAILRHLLGNALEAATQNVDVRLRLSAPEARAVVEIEDDGPGMDADFIQDRLFRPFASTKPSGYGIGAYQCRQLARELDGQLSVSSTPGKGTRMQVMFRTADAGLSATQVAMVAS